MKGSLPGKSLILVIFSHFQLLSRQLLPRKITHGFGLELSLELGLGGNFPRGQLSENPFLVS